MSAEEMGSDRDAKSVTVKILSSLKEKTGFLKAPDIITFLFIYLF